MYSQTTQKRLEKNSSIQLNNFPTRVYAASEITSSATQQSEPQGRNTRCVVFCSCSRSEHNDYSQLIFRCSLYFAGHYCIAKCFGAVDTFLHEKSTTPKTSCQSFPQKPGRFIASQYFSECNAATCCFVLDFLFRFMFPCTLLRTSTQHYFETRLQQETYWSSKKKRSVMTLLDLSNL